MPAGPTASPDARPGGRLVAINRLRGLVMVLMTIDHASDAFNAGRLMTDAAFMYDGRALPTAQFLTRWITHLCAPTFVFLAGTSLAISAARRRARGEPEGAIDRHLVSRGLFIAALDPLWMSLGFFGWSAILLQVMYAIGLSLVCMAALRRLPPRVLAVLGLMMLALVDEVVTRAVGAGRAGGPPPVPVALLVSGGFYGRLIVGYPLLPWLSIMMLGYALGARLAREPGWRPERLLGGAGLAGLAVFAVLRGVDGFGNAGLHRLDGSLVQWLHVSKYPPSLTYCGLELGLMALLLALFFRVSSGTPGRSGLLRTLGENALFYYLIHVHLLMAASFALGLHQKRGLGAAWIATALAVPVLYLACRRYAAYKRGHDNLLTRYV